MKPIWSYEQIKTVFPSKEKNSEKATLCSPISKSKIVSQYACGIILNQPVNAFQSQTQKQTILQAQGR
jgi:hypothetical protein